MSRLDDDKVDGDASPWRETARSLALTLATVAVLGFVTYQLWSRFARGIVPERGQPVTLACIHATPQPPPWIQGNVTDEVVVQGSLSDHHLLEPGLAKVVHRAFSNHPWVRKVTWASVMSGSEVHVELDYRRPLAVVVVSKDQIQVEGGGETGLLPIDSDAVWLPGFSEEQANQMPRVYAEAAVLPVSPGQSWRDQRIVQAAAIITTLEPVWKSLQLYSVHAPAKPLAGTPPGEFELRTRDHHRIIWGYPPGEERRGESRANDKIAQLRALATQNLLQPPAAAAGPDDPQVLIDLRIPPTAHIEATALLTDPTLWR